MCTFPSRLVECEGKPWEATTLVRLTYVDARQVFSGLMNQESGNQSIRKIVISQRGQTRAYLGLASERSLGVAEGSAGGKEGRDSFLHGDTDDRQRAAAASTCDMRRTADEKAWTAYSTSTLYSLYFL